MLKRMSQNIEHILPHFQNVIKFDYDISSLKEDLINAANGITDIIESHTLQIKSFTEGNLNFGGIQYISNSNILNEDLEKIANQAYDNGYIAGYVDWLAALNHSTNNRERCIYFFKSNHFFAICM